MFFKLATFREKLLSSSGKYLRFYLPKHLPEDERSFSRNVASLKNMIQDKTNCSFESIQHTEATNLNIFRKGLFLWFKTYKAFELRVIVITSKYKLHIYCCPLSRVLVLLNTHLCRIQDGGGAGRPPPPPRAFENGKVTSTNYIAGKRNYQRLRFYLYILKIFRFCDFMTLRNDRNFDRFWLSEKLSNS